MSLQEDAQRRAEALRVQSGYNNLNDSDSDDNVSDALFAAANALDTPSSVNTLNSRSVQNWNAMQNWPASTADRVHVAFASDLKVTATKSTSASSSPAVSTPSSVHLNVALPEPDVAFASPSPSSQDVAARARRDWQNHGTGITQALEDVRLYHHEELPTVRVFASSSKVDAAGQDYTAYLIRLEHPDSSQEATIIEHRFSDFFKLQQKLEGIPMSVVFPSRMTWAGRLGNWTPAQLLAPDQHLSLIQYRLKQLDAWLVHVLQLTPRLSSDLQGEVQQFLRAQTVVPCQQPLRMGKGASTATAVAAESLSWNNPITFSMGSSLRQACRTVETLCHLSSSNTQNQPQLGTLPEADHTIPLDLLRMARGILFVTVAKAGWVVSGRVGTGLLIQRLNASSADTSEPAQWSAPTAIGTFGVGWGLLAGADVTHYMVIFTADSAVRDLVQQSTTLQVGAELSAAVGPLGRSANSHLQTGDWTIHTAYAYAHSQGFFVGVSLEGSLWQVRHDVNAKFYGQRNMEATHLLHQPGPPAAQPLYDRMDLALSHQQQLADSSSWLPSPPPNPPRPASTYSA
jgi:lipid-binding SYLF domain-containing protein